MLLLDSDILIDALRVYNPALRWLDSVSEMEIAVAGYAAMELIAGCRSRADQNVVENLLSDAINLLKQHRLSHGIGIMDVLIAQTAISWQLPLHTFNIKHYSSIANLKIIQPYART